MFVGAKEKAAAEAMLTGAKGCNELSAEELKVAAQRYGVRLA